MAEKRIEKLKEMFLTTDLSEGAEIVAPSGAEWRSLTDRLRDIIRACTGQDLSIIEGGTAQLSALKDCHWVILGSAMNNPALMAFYRRKYAFVDDFYPGGDGYLIRTIHNPEACGHNVLLVGASSPEGATAALDRLSEILEENGSRLGYMNVARSGTHETLLPDMTPEAFQERTEVAFRGNAGRGPIEQGISLGLVHHFTHDLNCARMFRDVLFYYEDLVKERYDGEWCFEHMLFIYAWTWRLFYIWDLIEESDAFTDGERLRMTNLLWGLTNYVAELPYFKGEEPPPLEIRQNHLTFAGLSMSFSAGYFKTYYGIDDFEKHLRFCDAIFDGQAGCYKPNDDGGGGGYCWIVPNHQMIYDLKRDNFRFLEEKHLRGIADYAVLITDNLGSPVSFGDVGSYGARRSPSPGVTGILCKAAWYYEDGGYLGALEWMGGSPHHDCFYKAIPKRTPEHMTGIAVAPFNRSLYEWVERHGPGRANVPVEEAFDKLTLRGGFEENDEYLLIDGTSTFAHGHEDGNSIERLTWKGRMWLAETDYIWKCPRHHSSIVSICDEESVGMPSLVALNWMEDFGEIAFTRTRVPGYNGVDWTRDLLWVKGRYILVTDSLNLMKDADYDLRCLWRTLGDVRLEGDDLTVEQEGVFFRIRNADDSDKSLETEESRVAGQDPYKGYKYADGPIRIFKQRKVLRGRSGDVEQYFNLMVAGTEAEIDAYRITRIGEGVVRVEGPDGAAVSGVADGEVRIGRLR
ncbi:MAG: heparinase II/III family protein, partial [Candidatus Latescibacteria bacterium]|nr:heparinase II/III family protein [Candidatus Latescibacterota bacterium]